ncbi:rhomboid family intramembrane serine protease [Paracoccus sp. p4-l81]|uniref:rhomboid family intramembrane serine protease n=1 Tax=unclassified Paracoccus (in: a-proteobacteria) TaxID=2688777 RepID=UPI0035BA908E
MRPGYDESPLNALPPVVWLLVLPIIALEVVFAAGASGVAGGPTAVGWRLEAMQATAFIPEVLNRMIATGQYPPRQIARLVGYLFVHGSFTHALFVVVFILAMGKIVAETFGGLRFLAVFFLSGIGAALIYALLPWSEQPLIGGYPAVYGLIGAFTFTLWARLGQMRANRLTAFRLIAMLLVFQLVFAVIFGGRSDWMAEIAGFALGFGLSFLLAPGGIAALRDRLRHR